MAEFKSFVMNNKAFGNLFCNSQKSFHTSPGSSDSKNRGSRSFFKPKNIFFKHMPEDAGGGGKHVKVKNRRRHDILRFRPKTEFRVHRDPP